MVLAVGSKGGVLAAPISTRSLGSVRVNSIICLGNSLAAYHSITRHHLIRRNHPLPISIGSTTVFRTNPVVHPLRSSGFRVISINPAASVHVRGFRCRFIRGSNIHIVINGNNVNPGARHTYGRFNTVRYIFPTNGTIITTARIRRVIRTR